MTDVAPEGLRERKRRALRQRLSDTATEMFVARGFEAVTVAEIAAACDVSPGTIFNHFATKEDLFYDRIDEVLDAVCGAITDRAGGATVTDAVHALYARGPAPLPDLDWGVLRDPASYAKFAAWRRTEAASPALAARRALIADEWTRRIAAVLRDDLGLPAQHPGATAMAALLLTAVGVRDRVLTAALLENRPPREVRRRVTIVERDAFGRVGRACADIDRRRAHTGT